MGKGVTGGGGAEGSWGLGLGGRGGRMWLSGGGCGAKAAVNCE